MNEIFVASMDYRAAPVDVRGRLAFTPEHIPAALDALLCRLGGGGLSGARPEAVLLSTCNRTEVYVCAPHGEMDEERVRAYLAEQAVPDSGSSASTAALRQALLDPASPLVRIRRGQAAVHHLLRVACGLDSLVVGENEILGQVKTAAEAAQAAGASGPVLSALFRAAARAGKRARSETGLGQERLSVATVVVELARRSLGPLCERTALLIGAGKISSITARALKEAGLRCILIANRTYPRACELAERLGGQAVHFNALEDSLAQADLVICSTGAPHIVLHLDTVQSARALRPAHPLLVFDLAVPRDADPRLASLPGVQLVVIDDLQGVVQERFPLHSGVCQAVEAIISSEEQAFGDWLTARRAAPLIRALRQQASAVVQAQVDQTLRRLGPLEPAQQEAIAVMGQAIANHLLHGPITSLRCPPQGKTEGEWEDLFKQVFGLGA